MGTISRIDFRAGRGIAARRDSAVVGEFGIRASGLPVLATVAFLAGRPQFGWFQMYVLSTRGKAHARSATKLCKMHRSRRRRAAAASLPLTQRQVRQRPVGHWSPPVEPAISWFFVTFGEGVSGVPLLFDLVRISVGIYSAES